MRRWTCALLLAVGVVSAGCGGSSDSAESPASDAETASSNGAELVDRAIVESCAGFDAAKAAGMLGVAAADLEVLESFSERISSQTCRYWSAESNVGPGIQFLLNVQESGTAAARILDGQRSGVPAVQAITEGSGPALLEFDGFGDEAFWDSNTGGVNVRVRNVVVTVHAATSNKAMSDRDPGQMELERRVAEEVARALSS